MGSYMFYVAVVLSLKLRKHLIQSYRKFFGVSDNIRDGIVFFRLMFVIIVLLIVGIHIGYYLL